MTVAAPALNLKISSDLPYWLLQVAISYLQEEISSPCELFLLCGPVLHDSSFLQVSWHVGQSSCVIIGYELKPIICLAFFVHNIYQLRNCVDLKCLLDFESLKFKTKKRTSIRLNEEDKEIEAELEKLQEPGKSYHILKTKNMEERLSQ